VKENDIPWPAELEDVDDLSDYAVQARYPAHSE